MQIRQCGAVQSIIIAEVRASKEPMSINDLFDKPSIKAAVASKGQLYDSITSLYNRGRLRRVLINRPSDKAKYAYELGDGAVITPQKDKGGQRERLDVTIGKNGDYAELTLRGLRVRISIGD